MIPIPRTIQAWICEIRAAHADAAETIPFGPLAGVTINASDLFHLAPLIMLKFRGLARSRRNLKLATEAALSTYVASTSGEPSLEEYPSVCFALCYLASHYGLNLISKKRVTQIMGHISVDPGSLVVPEEEFTHAPKTIPKRRARE